MHRYAESFLPSTSRDTASVVGLVSGAHLVNHMYLVLLPPILGVLAADFGASLSTLGLAIGVLGAVNMVMQLPFGYLSDHYSRIGTMAVGLAVGTLGAFTIAAAPSLAWIFVGQALIGVGISAHHPAHFPMLSAATDPDQRGRVFSVHGFVGNLGYAAAPAVTTAVLALPGTSWRYAVTVMGLFGLLYATVGVFALSRVADEEILRPADEDVARERGSRLDDVRAELASLVASPAILALAVLAFVTALANWAVRSYAVVLLTDGYHLPLSTANAAYTVMFVVGAVSMIFGGELSDRVSARYVLLAGFGMLLVTASLLGTLLLPPLVAVAVVVLTGGTISFSAPARSKLADTLSASSDLGMNFALITLGIASAGAVAPPTFGAVISDLGFDVGFYGVAGLAVVGGVLTVLVLRHYRTELDG